MIYFFITTAIAIVIGLVAANIFKPGVGVTFSGRCTGESDRSTFFNTNFVRYSTNKSDRLFS